LWGGGGEGWLGGEVGRDGEEECGEGRGVRGEGNGGDGWCGGGKEKWVRTTPKHGSEEKVWVRPNYTMRGGHLW